LNEFSEQSDLVLLRKEKNRGQIRIPLKKREDIPIDNPKKNIRVKVVPTDPEYKDVRGIDEIWKIEDITGEADKYKERQNVSGTEN